MNRTKSDDEKTIVGFHTTKKWTEYVDALAEEILKNDVMRVSYSRSEIIRDALAIGLRELEKKTKRK